MKLIETFKKISKWIFGSTSDELHKDLNKLEEAINRQHEEFQEIRREEENFSAKLNESIKEYDELRKNFAEISVQDKSKLLNDNEAWTKVIQSQQNQVDKSGLYRAK